MQKNLVGIFAGVAATHVVLFSALMVSGGCARQSILAPRTYNPGVSVSDSVETPAGTFVPSNEAPVVDNVAPAAPVVDTKPAKKSYAPLKIDASAPVSSTVAASDTVYTVKAGDSLSVIAYKHGVKTAELAAVNNMDVKSVLKVGQKLTIPAGGAYSEERAAKIKKTAPAAKSTTSTKSTSTAKSTSSAAATAPAETLAANGVYTVKAGDSLDRIGRKFGTSAAAIAQANNISLKKTLQIGDKLTIPGKGATKTATTASGSTTAPATSPATPVAPNNVGDLFADPVVDSGAVAPVAPAEVPIPGEPVTAGNVQVGPNPIPEPVTSGAEVTGDFLTVPADMTLEDFCRRNNTTPEKVRALNPTSIPADGKLTAGTVLQVPPLL